MPLDAEDGAKVLQLITSRYDQREWRKKIEKTLSLPPSGMGDEVQRKIFMYFKFGLQAYKSRRADPPSWIVGGYATKEVVDRARLKPSEIDPALTPEHVAFLGTDPGPDVDEIWWEEMLVKWFEEPEAEEAAEEEGKEHPDDSVSSCEEDSPPKT
ncbi:MAG: hypothetical protein D6704_08745 [Nitrospirae bacterium]|nr:MAG: hypothetical protein D6704_08745 [Nitrospirota bacterium]